MHCGRQAEMHATQAGQVFWHCASCSKELSWKAYRRGWNAWRVKLITVGDQSDEWEVIGQASISSSTRQASQPMDMRPNADRQSRPTQRQLDYLARLSLQHGLSPELVLDMVTTKAEASRLIDQLKAQ